MRQSFTVSPDYGAVFGNCTARGLFEPTVHRTAPYQYRTAPRSRNGRPREQQEGVPQNVDPRGNTWRDHTVYRPPPEWTSFALVLVLDENRCRLVFGYNFHHVIIILTGCCLTAHFFKFV